METPPELPPAKEPLGARFYILLLAPLVAIAVGFCFANSDSKIAMPLLGIGALGTVVCSAILAIQLNGRIGKRDQPAVGRGILLFFALMAFYGVCCFVGCCAAVALS